MKRQPHYLGNMATHADRTKLQAAIRMAKSHVAEKGDLAQPDIWTHQCADHDALGSMISLSAELVRQGLHPRLRIKKVAPGAILLAARLGVPIGEVAPLSSGIHFLLDTCASHLVEPGFLSTHPNTRVIIDHHRPDDADLSALHEIRNREAISTCEMLASLIPASSITSSTALGLLVGIEGDTERLDLATQETMHIYARLLKISGVSRREVHKYLSYSFMPEVVRQIHTDLKDLISDLFRDTTGQDWIISLCPTVLDPFIMAETLRKTGADISAAVKEESSGLFRVSIRVGFLRAHQRDVPASSIARRTSELCGMPRGKWGGGEIDKAGALIHSDFATIRTALFRASMETISAGKTAF